MDAPKLKHLLLKLFVSCLLSTTCYGEMDVVFSPDSDIQELLIDNISRSDSRIDLAVSNLISGDLIQALTDARARGVNIRMVVDYQNTRSRPSRVGLLKEEGFKIKALKGGAGGRMNNNFAIFDDKLLITGTYDWTNKAPKYSHENVVILDDPDVIDSYRAEFERLYGEEDLLAWTNPGPGPAQDTLNRGTYTGGPVREVPFAKGEIPSPKEIPLPESARGDREFVEVTIDELNKLFGPESTLSRNERNELWKQYEGKYVQWNGVIVYKGLTHSDWNTVKLGFDIGESPEVSVIFRDEYVPQLMWIKEGSVIAYTARLNNRKSFGTLYRLDDGQILGKLVKKAPGR